MSSYVAVQGTPRKDNSFVFGLTPKEVRYLRVSAENIWMSTVTFYLLITLNAMSLTFQECYPKSSDQLKLKLLWKVWKIVFNDILPGASISNSTYKFLKNCLYYDLYDFFILKYGLKYGKINFGVVAVM